MIKIIDIFSCNPYTKRNQTNYFVSLKGFILWRFVPAFEWQTRQSKRIYRQDAENCNNKRGIKFKKFQNIKTGSVNYFLSN